MSLGLLVSIISILVLLLMGLKWKFAPLVGVLNQVVWIYYVIETKQWDLAYGIAGYTVVSVFNCFKWLKWEDFFPNIKRCQYCNKLAKFKLKKETGEIGYM